MVVILVGGVKRHLGSKGCLQLGDYVSSYGGCITTNRIFGLNFEL